MNQLSVIVLILCIAVVTGWELYDTVSRRESAGGGDQGMLFDPGVIGTVEIVFFFVYLG